MMLEPIAFPGMSILDPFIGEGSILRAAILSCRPIGLEIDKDRFPRLVDQVKQTYKAMEERFNSRPRV